MADIRVPTLGESVTEATVGKWFKKPGDAVAVDEPLVELETDKVTLEVPAPAAGVLADIAAKDGETVARRRAARPDQGRRRRRSRAKAAPPPPPRPPKRRSRPRQLRLRAAKAGRQCRSPPSVRKMAAESGVDAAKRRRLRQARPGHQGRHDGGDRARRRRADAGRAPPPCRCARRRRPTMPRAKSACT